jgi:hypothetical protein
MPLAQVQISIVNRRRTVMIDGDYVFRVNFFCIRTIYGKIKEGNVRVAPLILTQHIIPRNKVVSDFFSLWVRQTGQPAPCFHRYCNALPSSWRPTLMPHRFWILPFLTLQSLLSTIYFLKPVYIRHIHKVSLAGSPETELLRKANNGYRISNFERRTF